MTNPKLLAALGLAEDASDDDVAKAMADVMKDPAKFAAMMSGAFDADDQADAQQAKDDPSETEEEKRKRLAAPKPPPPAKAGDDAAMKANQAELAADKDAVLDNPMFTVLDQPGIGSYPVAASPVQFAAVPREKPQPAPILGQHTDEILSGILGLSSAEIGKLHDEKIVGGSR